MAATQSEPGEQLENRWLVAIAVSLGALLEIVDTSIVNVALNDMQAQMGATLSAIGWVVTSYAVANVIILPLSAWLGDTFGRKRYFVFSMVAFTIASMMCGLANSLTTLIIARVLQGIFGGGLLAKAQSILFEIFPREEQGKAAGAFWRRGDCRSGHRPSARRVSRHQYDVAVDILRQSAVRYPRIRHVPHLFTQRQTLSGHHAQHRLRRYFCPNHRAG